MFTFKRFMQSAMRVACVVVPLTVILLAVFVPNIGSWPAQEEATFASIQHVLSESQRYYRDCGRWPQGGTGDQIAFPDNGVTNWQGPYVRETYMEGFFYDSWGNAMVACVSGDRFYMTSAGADSKTNTRDDIVGWITSDGITCVKSPKYRSNEKREGRPR